MNKATKTIKSNKTIPIYPRKISVGVSGLHSRGDCMRGNK